MPPKKKFNFTIVEDPVIHCDEDGWGWYKPSIPPIVCQSCNVDSGIIPPFNHETSKEQKYSFTCPNCNAKYIVKFKAS